MPRGSFHLVATVAVIAATLAAAGAHTFSRLGSSPAAGCSLVVNPSASQCTTTADCLALGPAFAQSFCRANVCEVTCATNQDCSAKSGTSPRICRPDHTCASLLSADCPQTIADQADLDDAATLWFGLIAPLDPATELLSQAKIDAANLARNDFLVTAEGLPPVTDGGARRRFAFVVCDESVDPDRAARHLTDDVRVPAIIGPVYSGDFLSVAADVAIERRVLLISPSATSTFITTLPNKDGLVWRTAPSDTEQGAAIALLVSQIVEPALQSELDGGPLRLAVAYKGDGYGVGMAGALADDLKFNDAGAAQNGASYGAFNYGEATVPADAGADAGMLYEQTVADLLALKPHVVIIVGTREGITGILSPLEAQWGASPRPRYILSDGTYPVPELPAAVGGNDALRQRILGTTPGTSAPPFQAFVTYYHGNVDDLTVPIESTAATYDAAYMLAYAAAIVGATVTGDSLSHAFARLVSPNDGGTATPVSVTTGEINPTLDLLGAGGSVSLSGTSGPLDFDLKTGDTRTDIQVWCLGKTADGGAGFETTRTFYGAISQSLEGLPLNCP